MDIAQMLSVVFVHSLIKARVQVSWLLGHKTGILAQYSFRRPQKHISGKVEQCTLWSYSIGSFEFELFCENIPGVVMWPMKRTWPITCFTDFNWLKGLIFPVETSEFHKNSMTRHNPAFVYSNKNVYWTLSNLMVNWYRKKWPHIWTGHSRSFFTFCHQRDLMGTTKIHIYIAPCWRFSFAVQIFGFQAHTDFWSMS